MEISWRGKYLDKKNQGERIKTTDNMIFVKKNASNAYPASFLAFLHKYPFRKTKFYENNTSNNINDPFINFFKLL